MSGAVGHRPEPGRIAAGGHRRSLRTLLNPESSGGSD